MSDLGATVAAGSPFMSGSQPTLADVMAHLYDDASLSDTRRRDLCSAVRRFCAMVGREPARVPARMSELKKGLAGVSAAQAGVTGKTVQNLRSNLTAALRVAGANRAPQAARLNPEWNALHRALPGRRLKNGLSRLTHYCSAMAITPGDVDDAVMERFMEAVREHTFVAKPADLHRRATRLWNEAIENVPGWPQQLLTVPDHRRPRRSVPLSDLPETFQKDVAQYCEWLKGEDVFAAHPPPRACKPGTIVLVRDHIARAASAYVRRGHDREELQSLAELVEPARAKEILRFYLEHPDGEKRDFARQLADALIRIAKHWVRADERTLTELKDLRRRLGPQRVGLTEKNRATLRQFDDEHNVWLLLTLPQRLVDRAQKRDRGDTRTAVQVQIALAIEILLVAPMRSGNLIGLRLDRHVVRPGGRRGPVHLAISGAETKTGDEIEYPLPPETKQLLDLYLKEYRPRLAPPEDPWLFPATGGGRKSQATLYQQFKETVHKHTGLTLTPHQCRHVAAKLLLSADHGNFEAVHHLLGHRNHKTTTNFYSGLQTAQAARHYDGILTRMRQRLTESDPRRRPRGR